MTKKQVIWLLIRLIGLWFLWQAGQSAIALMGTFLTTIQNSLLLQRSIWLLLQTAGQMCLSFAIGLYCVGDGRILFTLLNREQPFGGYSADDDSASSAGSTTASHTSTLGLP